MPRELGEGLFDILNERAMKWCRERGRECDDCSVERSCVKVVDAVEADCDKHDNGDVGPQSFHDATKELDHLAIGADAFDRVWWVPISCTFEQIKIQVKEVLKHGAAHQS